MRCEQDFFRVRDKRSNGAIKRITLCIIHHERLRHNIIRHARLLLFIVSPGLSTESFCNQLSRTILSRDNSFFFTYFFFFSNIWTAYARRIRMITDPCVCVRLNPIRDRKTRRSIYVVGIVGKKTRRVPLERRVKEKKEFRFTGHPSYGFPMTFSAFVRFSNSDTRTNPQQTLRAFSAENRPKTTATTRQTRLRLDNERFAKRHWVTCTTCYIARRNIHRKTGTSVCFI